MDEIEMKIEKLEKQPLFNLGRIVATQGSMSEIPPEEIIWAIVRHSSGDWGDVCKADQRENEFSLKNGFRLVSQYASSKGTKFWVITEYDRSYTTVLLPSEY